MNIQSLSVVVPNKACVNHCASCPSRMHDNTYPVLIDHNNPDFDVHLKSYISRLEYARDNGCNSLMLTGTSEPQQNRQFLTLFGMMMSMMKTPFRNIEMQCTGVFLDEGYLRFLRRHVGVNIMALSVFSLNTKENMEVINPPKGVDIDIEGVASRILDTGMSLRICLNLTNFFDVFKEYPDSLFNLMKYSYNANQVTLRVLYAGDDDCSENIWVREHSAAPETVNSFKQYIRDNGVVLGKLPYGATKYGINGMSIVLDDDSMGKDSEPSDSYKYLILRPDCKLYSSWDTPASLIF